MSYSISARAASKASALEALAAKFDDVVAHQPIHAADKEQAMQAAQAFVGLLPVDSTRDVEVAVHGSISTMGGSVSYVECGVRANLVVKAAA